ncbi:MAG: prenyltransferase/squalene oxidase repeat-containing protein, partial [Planctomycetota bacterium]
MGTLRTGICTAILLLVPAVTLPFSAGQGGQERGREFSPQIQGAVRDGLAFLASQQRPNGSWTCRIGYKLYENYHGRDGEHVGTTALACMAFVSAGHTPGRGKYGDVVRRGLRYILECVRAEDGYVTANGTRMYSHAFATLFLAEIYGMSPRRDVKTKLKRAVALLVAAQNKEGGWRYSPMPVDADLSVT